MSEINKLTLELLKQGFTKEHYPDWVRPYDWFYGGFTYSPEKLYSLVFSTPCGLLVDGKHFSYGDMSFMGITWCPENDNPVVRCPYDKVGCKLNHPILSDRTCETGLSYMCQCACRVTGTPYDYERSYDKAWDDRRAYENQLKQEFIKSRNGFACPHHMYYHEKEHEWVMNYDPKECARWKCSGKCNLTKKELDSKKGNVFYDLKITSYRHDETLFDGQRTVTIQKGKKFLESPCSLTICKNIVKLCRADILDREKMRRFSELFFNPDTVVEVLNVRAEARETRDLKQDLADIQEGIKVVHASDLEKQAKATKKQRRADAKAKKAEKIKEKILQNGLDNLEPIDRNRAEKLFTDDEIFNIEASRHKTKKYVQESWF